MLRAQGAGALGLLAYCALLAATPAPAVRPHAPLADVNALARAEGNRRAEAVQLGRTLLATVWPAQILKIRIDAVQRHEVAGLMLSGVKFHGHLTDKGFTSEVAALVQQTFAASKVEEVDVWAVEPIPFDRLEPVSGDYAEPTDRIVFSITVRRGEKKKSVQSRLNDGRNVFWAPEFHQRLRDGGRKGPSRGSPNPASSPST